MLRGNKIVVLPEVFALTDYYLADVRFNIETKVAADRPAVSVFSQEFVDVVLAVVRSVGKVDRVASPGERPADGASGLAVYTVGGLMG
ncbi:hypothetical protein JK2ML_0325 [Mycobacterium leprae Kyoto-2]|uniref:Uncharacterized protein n=3 Tax=Mycobacterium leprae TaxID=1769 RepID=Q9CCW3_MYCLE|nr:hypothetical protein [Mycobacterium leprae]CAR70418.1 hypothetical protein MLBr00325 [Mycobacterium leprae Br4923]AWV47284.1 hypothetical protein DIJ64_01745 [Mycobacterium leprae]OAR19903.1 hypothetical protein A8144_13075 [Mycobacterium leprae 3125609]OAX70293.1 hypothetical protein A3216_12785 [Mycobacterium leprae 7935681]CAC29833.1 hypothetical protein [Mycobacterium leprae]